MPDLRSRIEYAVEPVKAALQADGADLALDEVIGEQARMRLILGPETCMDCIVPGHVMHGILSATILKDVPDITEVLLEDPRAASGTA